MEAHTGVAEFLVEIVVVVEVALGSMVAKLLIAVWRIAE